MTRNSTASTRRFSGTVTPLELYQRLHGQNEAPGERVESPFAPEQLATLVITDSGGLQEEAPVFGPSRRLDIELEVGALVGSPSAMGTPVTVAEADAEQAVLEVKNDWTVDGNVMIAEETTVATHDTDGVTVIDMKYCLTPQEDVTLMETAFGGFCVKGRKEGKAYYTDPKGRVDRPDPHHLKPETDWPSADWYDYTIDLKGGPTVGVAVIDHPGNPPSAR